MIAGNVIAVGLALDAGQGKIAPVEEYLRSVTEKPFRWGRMVRATAHRLAWDLAYEVWCRARNVLLENGYKGSGSGFQLDYDLAFRLWPVIQASIPDYGGQEDLRALVEAVQIESAQAMRVFCPPDGTRMLSDQAPYRPQLEEVFLQPIKDHPERLDDLRQRLGATKDRMAHLLHMAAAPEELLRVFEAACAAVGLDQGGIDQEGSRFPAVHGPQHEVVNEEPPPEQAVPRPKEEVSLPVTTIPANGLRVELRGRDKGPRVLGKEKPLLTRPQFDVVKALLDAGERGLSKDELDRKSGHGDARKILKRLADSDPDWAAVIHFPGKTGGGYRIR